jgi:LuxR family transcriptional regulator, maltose regulon positive regulatory protein
MASVNNIAKIMTPLVDAAMPRPRLFALLDEQRCTPLVWIYGPPGAGKTTLAASYFANSGQQCLWYRVDAGDNDDGTFFYYANLAVANGFPKLRLNLPLYTAEVTGGLETFARSYFRQLFANLDSSAALVFDNCHELLENAPLLTVFMLAIEELPRGVNICCISRNTPPAVFSKLQVYDQCRVLDWQALRFTMDESRELLRRFPTALPRRRACMAARKNQRLGFRFDSAG